MKLNCKPCQDGKHNECIEKDCLCREGHAIRDAKKELENLFNEGMKKHLLPLDEVKQHIREHPEQYQVIEKPKLEDYANSIKNTWEFKTLFDSHDVLYYNNGVYEENGETIILTECEKIIDECSKHKVSEVTGIIQRRTFTNRELFDIDPNILNLKNGLFNIETCELIEHSKEYLSRIRIPVNYKPDAKPVKILEFLETCLPDEKDRENLLQMAGKVLLRNRPKLEKMLLCTGGGNNGKSTWFDILGALFGDVVSNVSLHDITSHGYEVAELDGKLLNYRADIPSREIPQVAQLNEVVSGDSITARKIYGKPFKFKPVCTLMFSANQPPEFNDDTDALWKRFVIVEFLQKFALYPTKEELEDGVMQADPNLIEKLTTDEELSGLFNILIEKAKRVKEIGRIEFAQRTNEIRGLMKLKANPIQAYANECLIVSKDGKLPKSKVYATYQNWANDNKKPVLPERKFNEKLKQCLPITGEQKDRFERYKSPVSSWRGVIFRKGVPDVPDVPPSHIRKQSIDSFLEQDNTTGTTGTTGTNNQGVNE